MPDDPTFSESHLTPSRSEGARTPITWLLDTLSGFRLCVILLTALFVYCSVGSAGMFYPEGWNIFSPSNWTYAQIRQWPVFEMTEFEWFHTWFFYALCALLCVNMSTATIRRIPFNAMKLGAWMIHGGIIVLVIGCALYFSQKIEGDAPVWRRTVLVTVPGGTNATLPAIPGAQVSVPGEDGTYLFSIASIDPDWPILSGEDEGEQAYSVSVRVTTPRETFVRQMLAGYPQYTEDVLPGEGRVKKIDRFGGHALLDDTIALSLDYDPQDRFWVKDSSAIHLRIRGLRDKRWNERPIPGMPRYNPYLSELDDAFPEARDETMVRPIDLPTEREEGDTLADVEARVTGYLPYAQLQTRYTPSSAAPVNPVMTLELSTSDGIRRPFQLVALDPQQAEIPGGGVRFEWVDNPRLIEMLDRGASALLTIEVPEAGVSLDVPFTPDQTGDMDAEFTPIEGTEYAYRVTSILPRFPVNEQMISMAIMEIRTPDGTFARWVASDPSITRDLAEGAHMPDATQPRDLDPRFVTTFDAIQLSPVTIVAGPEGVEPRAVVMNPSASGTFIASPLEVGGEPSLILPGQGVSARIAQLSEHSERVTKPQIIAPSQRDANTASGRYSALARVELTYKGTTKTVWAPFHQYVFEREFYYTGSTGFFHPATVELGGETIEVVFGRETEKLPNPVVLDDFVLEEQLGGYTAQAGSQSVRNWTSELRFLKADGTWSDARPVSANSPKSFGDYWFFQASWDPPRPPSQQEPNGYAGLNRTGLGVGNREGVWTMLLGSALSVLGMLYAFYVKPILKRRRRDAVYAQVDETRTQRRPRSEEPTPVKRRGRALWFAIGVLVASGVGYLAVKASVRSAQADPSTFAGQVDLTPLDRSAVYSRGRLKSFDSYANQMLGFVTGNNRINGQPKDFTYLDMMFMPEAYADEAIIYVKKKQIRQRLIQAAELTNNALGPDTDERLERFMETGLVTPRLFEVDTVRSALNVLKRDVVKTAKFVNQIEGALTVRDPRYLAHELRLIPPPGGRENELWISPLELFPSQSGGDSQGMVLASELSPERRLALQDAFMRLGNFWDMGRTLERRADRVAMNPGAFEESALAWVESLPERLDDLKRRAGARMLGVGSMSDSDRLAALDDVALMIEEAGDDVTQTQASGLFELMLYAEMAAPDEFATPRIEASARRTNRAVAEFCALLPQEPGVENALYPDQTRLMLESWYFKLSGATWIWIVYLLSVLMLLMAVVYKWSGARAMGMGLFTSAFLMHTVVLGWRWYVSGRWPNSNMFEAVTTSVWLGTLCVIVIEVFARRTPMRNLFALTAAGASMVAMMAAAYLPQLDANINNMMPILNDLWLYIHTNVIIASYALIAMASITGLLYLAWRATGKGPDHATVGGTDMLLRTAPASQGGSAGLKRRVSAGAVFDGATMILIELSLVMLWAGLVMGAIWADHSWGRPWGWDPKEVFALNTFFVYLILVHVRLSSKDKGLWTALLALVGCGVMLFNWIVINFIISGLHSYA